MLTVKIKPWNWPEYTAEVVRITKNWVVVKCNDIATMKLDRVRGYNAGAFRDNASRAASRIVDESLSEINKFAESQGGTWNSGWKPAKRK